MTINSIITEKKEQSINLKKSVWLLLKYKPLGLIHLSDLSIPEKMMECLWEVDAGFIIYDPSKTLQSSFKNVVVVNEIDSNTLWGFDFIVCDDEIVTLSQYMKKGVAPIILRDNHLNALLSEFNPMKNQWNAFFYERLNGCSIFYTIVRYLENYKFPYDNKNLISNLIKS